MAKTPLLVCPPVVVGFLRDALAGGPLGVPELAAKARTAGLLAEGQHITHSKLFKRAKKSLNIRSVRTGFGAGGEWVWLLDQQVAPPNAEGKWQHDSARHSELLSGIELRTREHLTTSEVEHQTRRRRRIATAIVMR